MKLIVNTILAIIVYLFSITANAAAMPVNLYITIGNKVGCGVQGRSNFNKFMIDLNTGSISGSGEAHAGSEKETITISGTIDPKTGTLQGTINGTDNYVSGKESFTMVYTGTFQAPVIGDSSHGWTGPATLTATNVSRINSTLGLDIKPGTVCNNTIIIRNTDGINVLVNAMPINNEPCSENKIRVNGECICKQGYEELDDLTCAVSCPVEKHFVRKNKKECGCEQLYRLSEDKSECIFSPEHGFTFNETTRENFQDTIVKLDANTGVLFEGTLADGTPIKIGIFRLPGGKLIFTKDGENYSNELQNVVNPGIYNRISNNVGDLWRGFKGIFGIGKYTGKKSTNLTSSISQTDGQMIYDASVLSQKQLETTLNDSETKNAIAKDVKDTWIKRAKNPATGQWDEQFLEELKNATGIDVPTIKKVLNNDLVGVGKNIVGKITTFPAESVTTLATELRSSSYNDAVKIYIVEREAGLSPELLVANPTPELNYVSSIKGIGQQYATDVLFKSYEEAYQRYLILKKLSK